MLLCMPAMDLQERNILGLKTTKRKDWFSPVFSVFSQFLNVFKDYI